MDVFNEKKQIVQTSRKFHTRWELQQVVVSMEMNPKDFAPGYYICRVAFYNNITDNLETVETRFRKLESKRDYKIFVDVDNRCFVDGKLFFPLGMYSVGLNDTQYKDFINSPYNVIMSSVQLNKAGLDAFYEKTNKQVRVINAAGFVSWKKDEWDKVVENARKKAKEWKQSEGFFGYYLVDEPDIWLQPIMTRSTLAIREEDKDHVVWPAINQRWNLGKFKEGFDVVGMDCYPLQTFDELTAIYSMGRDGRKRMGNSRALWNIPQIFDWTTYNRSNESPPTEMQLKNMVYQWISIGGMGIIYFHLVELVHMNYKNPYYDEWNKIKRVSEELMKDYVPIILSNVPINPGYYLPIYEGLDYTNRAAFRIWRYNNRDYILIINTVQNMVNTYTFEKPAKATLKVKMHLTGKSKIEHLSDTKVKLTLQPYEVLWFEGSGDEYKADESQYDKPNVKSKFDASIAKENLEYGTFPKLPDVPEETTNPNGCGSVVIMVILSIILMII